MAKVDLWDDIMKPFAAKIRRSLRVSVPALVQQFNRATQRVNVNFRAPFRQGANSTQDLPPGQSLPVWMWRAGGYVSMAADLAENDPCVTLVGDQTQDRFWTDGQAEAPQLGDPHNLAYAVAFPGGRFSQNGPINEAGEAWSGAEDGSATTRYRQTVGSNLGVWRCQAAGDVQAESEQTVTVTAGTEATMTAAAVITLEAPEIKLGDTAVKTVVLDQDPVAPDTNFIVLINALAGYVNGQVPGTVPPPVLALFETKMGNVTSTAVKAKAE